MSIKGPNETSPLGMSELVSSIGKQPHNTASVLQSDGLRRLAESLNAG